MSEEYIWLIYERIALHRQPDHTRNVEHTLEKDVWGLLTEKSQLGEEVVTEEIGSCL